MRSLNPGSVGQPRDGLPDAAYAILETGEDATADAIEFRRVRYDIDRTQRADARPRAAAAPRRAAQLRTLSAADATGRRSARGAVG